MLDYECLELGFNSGMLRIVRSVNNPSYDHDLLKSYPTCNTKFA